ncbi:PAS domain S-box protein [Psychroflexus sp. YR1-1]|uniref:histidine kinase n=1 Tax=Psychroflexus aurantiacus TaxID=2709310 RepID=A0A6B3R0B0_9FLAO|nr:PAS domain S-box protein [Psychroflexus aurantiacus]NEV94003.1 PAS domain S-box protein [Psychroflexus aurantiacus]
MSSPLKILHLEDTRSDAILIERSIRKEGFNYEIMVVENKKDYRDALDSFVPDIILSDHSLPGFDSIEALEILHNLGSRIPFILITSVLPDEIAVTILKNGASDYILKDRLERLPAAIENALERLRLELERQEYIELLTSNERKLRRMLEHGSDPVMLLNKDGRINYISPNVQKMLGYSEEEILNLGLHEIYHPEDVREAFLELSQCIDAPGDTLISSIKRMKHKNEAWRWVEVSLTNLLNDPDVNSVVNNLRDVTERRKSEQIIRESEEKYRSFFENSLDGILLTAKDGRVFAANPAACRIFRMTEKEICEAERLGLTDSTDPRLHQALQEREISGKTSTELTMLRKGGIKFPAELTSSVFKNAQGEIRTSMTVRDISDKKQAEEKLKSSEEKYRLLFEFNPLPNWIFDHETLRILDVNQAAIQHYGYSRDEFLQLTIMDLRDDEGRHQLSDILKDFTKEGGESYYGKLKLLKKDKTPILVDVYAYELCFDQRECSLVISNDITNRVKALKQLETQRNKLATAERIAKMGYWELDLKDNSLFWTDEIYRIWEVQPENFTPTFENLLESIHPEDLENFKKAQENALSGTAELNFEHRILFPDGSIKWVHEKGKLIKDKEGLPVSLEGTVQDITVFKRDQEKLILSESRFRSLIKSQTNYVVRVDLEGNYVYCNDTFLKDYSWLYPGDSIVKKNSLNSIKDYHHQRVNETVEKCFAEPNTVFQVEMDKPAKGGGVNTTLWDFICITDSQGHPEEIQSVGINITDRVQAEKESRFQANLLDKIGQAVLSTDVQEIINYWNKSAEKIYGWTREEALGKTLGELIPLPATEGNTFRKIEDLKPGEVRTGEFKVKKKDGTEFQVLITDSPVYDENMNLAGMVGISSDITDRIEAEFKMQKLNKELKAYTEELVLANKGLEQFSYIVSHNLRAPIANIIGLGDLMKIEDHPKEVQDKLSQELINNVERLDTVIRDLNVILSVKSDILKNKEPIALPKLINLIKMSIKDLIDKEQVTITTDFNDMQQFRSIHSYMQSIFYNLILNSIKYKKPDQAPVIHIEGKKEGKKFIFSISDNGLGIDLSKNGKQVFGLYKRFHQHKEGKGMGLFMVKTQVEMLGGKISISSKPNRGTTFVIEFSDK